MMQLYDWTIDMKIVFAILGTFVGCGSNAISMEVLVKADPGSGNLITFLQFAFIAAEGFLFTANCGREKLRINLREYTLIMMMVFVSSVCNNYAFDLNIPMPLHMIFRSGSLIANMIMGIVILRKRYILSKYVAVLMITVGIVVCTIVSGRNVRNAATPDPITATTDEPSAYSVLFWWAMGIGLLTVALLITARMGIYQEVLYKRYGKHPREALYVTHILPLPAFLLFYKNIWEHMVIASNTDPVNLLACNVPIAWIHLLVNCVTQHVCIASVYVLTTECSSLTVTLVVTLRKFVSLLFSIVHFQNPFTVFHWIGTAMVFVGTLIFTEMIPSIGSNKPVKFKPNTDLLCA